MIKKNTLKIIAEIHPQHKGSMNEIKRMILQCKFSGADIVKVQLYDSKKLFNDEKRGYLEISKDELAEINNFCINNDIELSASIFDLKRVDWCSELKFKTYKIASRSVDDRELCEKIISLNKNVIISLGMYDFVNKKIPYEGNNIDYLYCVSKYPASYEDVKMPDFRNSFFKGYSDHTIGNGAALFAIARGAKIIEKHFTNNKALNIQTEMAHVCSMDQTDLMNLRNLGESLSLLQTQVN
jgi:N,N'-diacetyllegionaminate synthase